jgi:hypothetical protein
MGLLSHEHILELHGAAISAGLVASRAALLAGVDASLVAGLSHATSPSAQILLDLHELNAVGRLGDGSAPLATWLANAGALSGARGESRIFSKGLASCSSAPALSAGGPMSKADGPRAPKPAAVRRLLAQVLSSDSDLDAFCLDHFRSTYDRFSSGMDRVRKVNLLFERATPVEIVARLREQDPEAVEKHEHQLGHE